MTEDKYLGRFVKRFEVSSMSGVTTKETVKLIKAMITTYISAIDKDFGMRNFSSLVTIGDNADIKITAIKIKIITSLIKNNAQIRARKAAMKNIVLWEISIFLVPFIFGIFDVRCDNF